MSDKTTVKKLESQLIADNWPDLKKKNSRLAVVKKSRSNQISTENQHHPPHKDSGILDTSTSVSGDNGRALKVSTGSNTTWKQLDTSFPTGDAFGQPTWVWKFIILRG